MISIWWQTDDPHLSKRCQLLKSHEIFTSCCHSSIVAVCSVIWLTTDVWWEVVQVLRCSTRVDPGVLTPRGRHLLRYKIGEYNGQHRRLLKIMWFWILQTYHYAFVNSTWNSGIHGQELITNKGHDKRVVCYALGILLIEMTTGKLPFTDENCHVTLKKILQLDYYFPSHMSIQL